MNDDVRLFGLGHSQLRAILRGAELLSADEKIAVDGISLREDAFRNLPKCAPDSPAVREVRTRAAAADLVFLSIHGNAHSVLGLVEPPVPIDFYHADLPHLPIQEGAAVVPYRTIREVFEDALYGASVLYGYLKRLLDRPMVQCQPPPPKPSESQILKRPGAFREKLDGLRVAASSVRLKMWKVQSDVMQAMCEEAGIGFLPCPDAALDDSGFLAESAWAPDATHANAVYGALVLRQLATIARSGARAPCFSNDP